MNTYYVEYPREFANEYTVYAVNPHNHQEFTETVGRRAGVKRITRKDAVRLGWTRPREAKRDGEQWFGGFAEYRGGDTLDEKLGDCLLGTIEAMRAAKIAECV